MGYAPILSGIPFAPEVYFVSRPSPFNTSNASGADAQNRSERLLSAVSWMYLIPAVVFFFSISISMPGLLLSKADLNGFVKSFGKEVTTTNWVSKAYADMLTARSAQPTMREILFIRRNSLGNPGLRSFT
uniref:Uncharacterized protein n=1 Tax=Candidatus Kentrum sp. UNK TaxID=2126344 RepID=A0A451ASG0_9GAMM|nr:MAG: hypothetical protein BECKUNK1418G_GA0071005_104117 [Candidatus Kentron sp. UNK]VFK68927.1 MAG: hypothetical protein BECKUNK1418H_GA0071006_100811 [Candidatus Kentron sp. UNK]